MIWFPGPSESYSRPKQQPLGEVDGLSKGRCPQAAWTDSSQGAQHPLIKEVTLNHMGSPNMS